jgi:hypothetical protein
MDRRAPIRFTLYLPSYEQGTSAPRNLVVGEPLLALPAQGLLLVSQEFHSRIPV